VYEVEVEGEFCAAHAILIKGEPEPLHGHNWRVRVTVAGANLDADGLLCDFHIVERALKTLIAAWNNRSLNEVEPFFVGGRLRLNPTAEHVARAIADGLIADLRGKLPKGGRSAAVTAVRVTEAPGCAATYFPGRMVPSAPLSAFEQ
jgi:6-pyruvoyltetrahydropterin/6-carboxytetrahydropterin synthase